MTLIRLIQRASILAGMTFTSLPFYSNPASAQLQACIITNNGKTVCGQSREIERMCVSTDGSNKICGKFKSVKEEQAATEAKNPTPIAGYRKEIDNFVYTLEICQRVSTNIRCQVKMTNKGKERSMYSEAPKSSLVDSSGKSHPGSKVDIGGSPSYNAGFTIAPGADAYFSIAFEDVSGSIVKAQLLNLNMEDRSINKGGIRPVQFQNIPILK
jgi:hypothetical protein